MKNEIERKFLITALPSLEGINPLRYERYILSNEGGREKRIQKVNDNYFYEEKVKISAIERSRTKKEITKEEFEALKSQSIHKPIFRDRYDVSSSPDVSIQIYHGDYEGLIRAEVEFDNTQEANAFTPLPWMGNEITDLPIAKDAELSKMSPEELKKHLNF